MWGGLISFWEREPFTPTILLPRLHISRMGGPNCTVSAGRGPGGSQQNRGCQAAVTTYRGKSLRQLPRLELVSSLSHEGGDSGIIDFCRNDRATSWRFRAFMESGLIPKCIRSSWSRDDVCETSCSGCRLE